MLVQNLRLEPYGAEKGKFEGATNDGFKVDVDYSALRRGEINRGTPVSKAITKYRLI